MITAVPSTELEKNYNFLKSPIFGQIAFSILESRGIIEFFSNQFLFSGKCDSTWLDETEKEMSILARPPIQAFNAGLLQHRSFEDELKRISQPTYILSGAGDKRAKDRVDYGTELQQCTLITLDGTNVIPWESPIGVIDLIKVVL
jgi:pimeloyl-ACP methyl ester carboxylesterase